MLMSWRSFEVHWDEAQVQAVRARVAATVLPPAPAGAGWAYGCDADFLRRLQAFWVDRFDWRAALASLNRHPQSLVRVDDLDIHVVHVRGESARPRPLLMTHGWPGSYHEFWDVIEPLAFPSRFGGRAEDAFDLVLPTLPGYGYSSKPSVPMGPRAIAGVWNRLMTEGLGYPRYLAQGGDWGAIVTSWLGLDHGSSVAGIHLNLLPFRSQQPPADEAEKAWMQQAGVAQQRMGSYSALQAMKPQSLAWATADNPLGQAAWIVERFHDWADLRERRFEDVFSMQALLTNIMLYVMPGSFGTAAWLYAGMVQEGRLGPAEGARCETPTAYASFHDPLVPSPPRSRAEMVYDITRWTQAPHGGHFAAMENPEFFATDVRDWAAGLPSF
jgi:pimeloyl-ACP methyl ester carboxylesterase